MPIPTATLNDIIKRGLAVSRTSFPGKPMGTKRFLSRNARAVGLNVWGFHRSVEEFDKDIIPSPDSSDEALQEWAERLGLPNGAGGFGKIVAQTASGGAATLTGAAGTTYPVGRTAIAEDGSTRIELIGTVIIPGSSGLGSVVGHFSAVTAGPDGNLSAGTVCTWETPPSGADASFVLTSALTRGAPIESNADVYARIVDRLQNPARGGSNQDYRNWAIEGGAAGAYVYPKRSGAGSVDLVIFLGGHGQNRIPTAEIQQAVEDVIAAARPSAVEGVNVLLPYMPDGHGLVIRVRVVPFKDKFAFDWDSSAGPYLVDAYSDGPPATIRLTTVAPQSLLDAIQAAKDAHTEQETGPRLQVLSSPDSSRNPHPIGSQAVNLPVRTVDASTSMGKTTLTLQTLPAGWIKPGVGDSVFAYGPVVGPIASGILDLVDSLGASRGSGFGDAQSPWLDRLAVSEIERVASNALDTDGTRLVEEILPGSATIDGVADDVVALDVAPNGPELLWAVSIAVTD